LSVCRQIEASSIAGEHAIQTAHIAGRGDIDAGSVAGEHVIRADWTRGRSGQAVGSCTGDKNQNQ